jgi:hypothetical protein
VCENPHMGEDVNLPSSERVIAKGIREVVPQLLHRMRIEDAVNRIHRITIDATELVARHIVRCIHEGIQLPVVSKDYYKMAMMLVTEGNGELRKVDTELLNTRKTISNLEPVSRVNLDQLMMARSISLAASFDTNLHVHFRKRVARYVRLLRQPDPETKEERKVRKLENLMVASDVCKGKGRNFESPAELHPMIRMLREQLETDNFTSDSMETNVKRFQTEIIGATHRMNAAFETNEQRCLSVCPLRRRVTPGFIQIDTKGIQQVLGLDQTDYERERKKNAYQRRKAFVLRNARNQELRKAVGFAIIPRVKAKTLEVDVDRTTARASARRIQRAWRRVVHVEVCRIARKRPLMLQRLQRAISKWAGEQREDRRCRAEGLLQCKEDVWRDVLNVNRKTVRSRKDDVFAGSLRTDGVSVRLFFKSSSGGAAKGKKRKRGDEKGKKKSPLPIGSSDEPVPSRGLYVIDELKHLSRMKAAQVLGADPGKRELLVCVDADAPKFANEKRQRLPSVRYTMAQRRKEMRSDRHTAERVANTPVDVATAMHAMTDTNSRSANFQCLTHYFDRRREWLEEALAHFQESLYRYRRWQRFMAGQSSFASFMARIRALQRDSSTPLVIAYGAWGGVAGRPGAACNRGTPPCIGKGLRHKLSKHFCVISTPERMTSKTCSICESKCGPCKEVDAFHRVNKIEKAGSDAFALSRAQRFSVRGLRRCSNVECAAHLNRDYNAAINIQRRCKSMLAGGELPAMGEMDEQLDALQMLIQHGD